MLSVLLTAALTLQSPIDDSAVLGCIAIERDKRRLACYDESVGRLEAAEAAGEVTTISKSEVEEIERDSFGFSLPSIARNVLPRFGGEDDEQLARVEEAVASVRRLNYDNLRITLEIGQVWEQTDTQRIRYSTRNGVESAEIKKASLGSFKMKLDGGRAFRVKRVK